MTLSIAAEWQGFCRDLHDLATDYFVQQAGLLNGHLQAVLTARMTDSRDLDRGNAHAGALGRDFGRFGLQLWPELKKKCPGRAGAWNQHLEALNGARNAIAHANDSEILALAQKGYPLSQLATIRKFRRAVVSLAPQVDDVVGEHLGSLFQQPKPW